MSIFSDTTPTTEQGQETDNTKENHEPEDFLQAVVSEKGEQWNDPQALAKGYWHSQQRIRQLEEAVNNNDKNDYAKELLDQLRQKQAPTAGEGQGEDGELKKQPGSDEGNTSLSTDDVDRLLEQRLTEREKQDKINKNIESVTSQLQESYGTEAQKVIQDKAKEMGLTVDRMKEIAGESPDAFLRLVGEAPRKETNKNTDSSVNTVALSSNGNNKRNADYYSRLRRENRKLYYDPKTQAQMLRDAQEQGSAFYNK